MKRIIHTGDIHLDAPFAYLPPAKQTAKREALKAALERIVDRVLDEQASALIVAGDLFNIATPRPDTVSFVINQFNRLLNRAQIIVVPGNHDFYQRNGIWDAEAWPDNTLIFRANSWSSVQLEQGGLTVAGIACHDRGGQENVLKELDEPADIVVMHGSHKLDFYKGQSSYPFGEEDAAGLTAEYLALGHYHNSGRVGETIAYYCGSPEGLCFDETGRRSALLVEIGNGPVRVDPLDSGRYIFKRREIDCTALSDQQQIEDEITGFGGADDLIAVALKGAPALELNVDLEQLSARLADAFFYLDIQDYLQMPAAAFDPGEKSIKAKFAERMQKELAAVDDEAEKQVISLASRLGLAALEGRLQK